MEYVTTQILVARCYKKGITYPYQVHGE